MNQLYQQQLWIMVEVLLKIHIQMVRPVMYIQAFNLVVQLHIKTY